MQNYLIVSVGNNVFNLIKNDKKQITDRTTKCPNQGGSLLQQWKKECNNKISRGKITNLKKSTKTSSPTGNTGSASLPLIGDSFIYIEKSSNDFERLFSLVFEERIISKSVIFVFS